MGVCLMTCPHMRKILSIIIATTFVTASLAKAQDTTASPSPSPAPEASASPAPAASPSATPKAKKPKAKKSPTPASSPAATTAGKSTTKASPSPTAAASATPKKKKAAASATPAKSPAPGAKPGDVWVNTSSKVYHKEGSKYFGTTAHGKYMTEDEAKKEGFTAAKN
jgi:hypothetical protein